MTDPAHQAWADFCDGLKALGDIVASNPHADDLDRAEGYRYLTRLLRLALEMNLEHRSAAHPSFYSLSHDTAKIGADNPDNIYLNANIDGNYDYEIVGNVGTVPYLSFGSKENRYAIDGTMVSTGEVELSDLTTDADGGLRLVVARNDPGGNWLPIRQDSNMVIVRQTLNDRDKDVPATLKIRRLSRDPAYDKLSTEDLANRLTQTLGFVGGTSRTFLGWVQKFRDNHDNRFDLGDQSFFQAAGGDPNICYIYAFFTMAPDDVLRVHSPVPACDYWNFQLTNTWMESHDYRHHPVHLNGSSAELDADGSVTIHVTDREVSGLKNNIIATGHTSGVMLMRWVGASEHPVPSLERLSLKGLL